jgi:hypothetical protein
MGCLRSLPKVGLDRVTFPKKKKRCRYVYSAVGTELLQFVYMNLVLQMINKLGRAT